MNIRKEMMRDADDRLPHQQKPTDNVERYYPVNPNADRIREVLAQAKLSRKRITPASR